MISGRVTNRREAVVPLIFLTSSGHEEMLAVIDTGFNGWLTLPAETIAAWGLEWDARGRAVLADGTEITFDRYRALLVWDGQPLAIYVASADSAPLLGMSLLEGYELNIQARVGGSVTITKLS